MKKFFQSIIDFFKGMFNFKKSKEKLVLNRTFTKNFDPSGKVYVWREREKNCNKILDLPDLSKMDMLTYAVKRVQKEIVYMSDVENWDKTDYWPTSQEVFERKREDCDGKAIAMWRILKDSGKFDDREIGLVIICGHMLACYHLDNDFYVLDNGFVTKEVELASKVFPVTYKNVKFYPLYGFNLTEGWIYKQER